MQVARPGAYWSCYPGWPHLTQRAGDGRATADLRPTPPAPRGDPSRAGSDDGGPSSSSASISTIRTPEITVHSSPGVDGGYVWEAAWRGGRV
jgi:hypothetical protein